MTYEEWYKEIYLKSFHWKMLSDRIKNRDNYTCQICGKRPTKDNDLKLNVHHITYKPNIFAVKDEDLITLCEECHRKIHTIEVKK